ncbi:MAG: LysR family transcriptional regulator [Clostridia bacterium]|nr:LysR family transcriptional regulator [Deltaproteobacteria bacterium]
MDIRTLRSFLVLADRLHFGKAARVLNLSQPALSKQIRSLEDELGGALFTRSRHGVALTGAGRNFTGDARGLVALADKVLASGQDVIAGRTGLLAIAFGVSTFEIVPRIIARFRDQRPGVRVNLVDQATASQVDDLVKGVLDIGFLRFPVSDELETLALRGERAVLVTPATYPEKFGFGEVNDAPFISLARDRSAGFNAHVARLCAHRGIQPRIVQEAREFPTVLALVAAGIGVAIVPESAVHTAVEDIRVHPIRGREASWQVGAAWRRGRTEPLLTAFIQVVRGVAAEAWQRNPRGQ